MNRFFRSTLPCIAATVVAVFAIDAGADGGTVYRCPGDGDGAPPLYTDALSPKDAQTKGCRTLGGAPINVIQASAPKPRAIGSAGLPTVHVDPAEQHARDSDARRILEAELAKVQADLTAAQKDYNNGEPDRQGGEKNAQKYIDRVAEMKAGAARKESDVAAIKREIAKLP